MKLLGRDSSYNVQKVLWLLDELELEYEHKKIGGKFGGLDTPDFYVKNPFRKVPVLIDEDEYIWESNTILRYLAASYGEAKWWTESPFERTKFERWMDWSIDKLESAFVGVFWGFYRTPESKRDWQYINKSKEDCLYCLSKIDAQLEDKKYLSGDNISLADIAVGVFLYRLVNIELGITFLKNTDRWYLDLQSRSGFRKWVMSDFSELKGREEY